jgi:hypothetical protein
MNAGARVRTRRTVIRAIVVLFLVGVGFLMRKIGREFDVIIDNGTANIGGARYEAMEYGMVTIDGDAKKGFNMWAKDRVIKKMVGTAHKLSVQVVNEDDDSVLKTVERQITLGFNQRALMVSIPAILENAPDILTPNPLYSPEPAIVPGGGPEAPDTPDTAGGEF